MGRFLPYFFPDTFHEGGDPVKEAKDFIDYVESVGQEFRTLYNNIKGTTP